MINDEAKNCYYFAVKNLLELDSLRWLRGRKKEIINGANDFQKALGDALNYQNIETHPERISKTKPYISKYNWERKEFPARPKDWKNLNKIIRQSLLIFYLYHNAETIRVAYRSEYNNKREKQANLLMITEGNKLHYLAITNLSALESYRIIMVIFMV